MRGDTRGANYNLDSIGVDVDTGGAQSHVEVTCTGVGNGRVRLGQRGQRKGGMRLQLGVIRADLV